MASEIGGNDSLNRLTPRGDVRAHIEYLLIQGRQFRRMPMVNGCTFWITSSHLDGDTCFMKMDGLSADLFRFLRDRFVHFLLPFSLSFFVSPNVRKANEMEGFAGRKQASNIYFSCWQSWAVIDHFVINCQVAIVIIAIINQLIIDNASRQSWLTFLIGSQWSVSFKSSSD